MREKGAFGITSVVGALIGIQAGRLTSRARVRPTGSTRTGESSLPAVITTRRNRISGAEAADEAGGRMRRRSGATKIPGEPPAGQALETSGSEQWGSPKGAPGTPGFVVRKE